jgi:hypothetical protein
MIPRRNETQKEIANERDPRVVRSPEINPRKKPKSDLTLAFSDSSGYVNSLAIKSERALEIGRMRQKAVSNRPA